MSRRFSWGHVQLAIALVAFGVAIFALHGALREFHYREVTEYVATLRRGDLLLALAFAFLSLLASSSLDLFALRHLGRRVPSGAALLSSLVSTSVSNVVSPALLAAFPPLPVEVAYRVVGRTLIVIDVKSRLIVDVARLVLPPAS